MPNIFDLQIQSTASDGRHTPSEIASMARERGLTAIALTDHDTVAGIPEALEAGRAHYLRVSPGIEISVEERGAHILGFGIDYQNAGLLGRLEEFRKSRIAGARQMVKNLAGAGFAVSWNDVQSEAVGGLVARPHIARAILGRAENKEELGETATAHDFIERFLSDESPYYVRRAHISAKDGIALVHSVGGVAAWSHPAIHFQNDPDGLENFLKELAARGVDGVEVFNPSHTEDETELLNSLAAKYGLLRTAGSDFHEKGDHPADERGLHAARFVGDFETYGFHTEDIIPKLDEALERRRRG